MTETTTTCCIAGGGPAGMMLGYLLARAGIEVVVLEKHADFLRDFRGDTVHPSTLEVMNELGLYDEFLQCPHQQVDTLTATIGEQVIHAADFTHLPTRAKFMALMPQWDFLNFLAAKGKAFKEFHLAMNSEVTDLIRDGDRVTGVKATTPDGEIEISASLVVACDGRDSKVRDLTGLKVTDLGAPMDVLWMRLPRGPDDEGASLGHAVAGRILVLIPRGDYFQCGFVVRKGEAAEIRAKGLDAFRAEHRDAIVPRMRGRTGGLKILGRYQAAQRLGRPAGDLVRAGCALHRRRGPRHEPCRRGGDQPGDPGRGGCRQSAAGAAVRGPRHSRRPPGGPATPRMADQGQLQAVQVFIQTRMIAPTLAEAARPGRPGRPSCWRPCALSCGGFRGAGGGAGRAPRTCALAGPPRRGRRLGPPAALR